MSERVRAPLITPVGDLLTIRRVRPGEDPYWVLPGYFYLGRVHAWSANPGDRSGPEFKDPARGEYHLQTIPLTVGALAAIDPTNWYPEVVAGAGDHVLRAVDRSQHGRQRREHRRRGT